MENILDQILQENREGCMEPFPIENKNKPRVTFVVLSLPAKALATCIILTLALGMFGALGQIIVHDIIPTFYTQSSPSNMSPSADSHNTKTATSLGMKTTKDRGDLFSELSADEDKPEHKPFYKGEQFIWTLKWTHIHLFGMSMIFIFIYIFI